MDFIPKGVLKAARDRLRKANEIIRKQLVQLVMNGQDHETNEGVRRALVSAARLASKPNALRDAMNRMEEFERLNAAEIASWIDADAISRGESGRFNACDLRNWLAIAEKAGVAAIPAREIASFTMEEYGALSGSFELPSEHPRISRALSKIAAGLTRDYSPEELDQTSDDEPQFDMEELNERLHSAMDDVPEGWMVRSAVCGGDLLKTMAGCGVTDTFIPEIRFGPDLEVGPGWVRTGNRRRIQIEDARTMKLNVPHDPLKIAFLARPWIVASRWIIGRDPHRANTPFDIPGAWPAEWRAFIKDGKVTGVSAYYPWAGQIDTVSARNALHVRELAQKVVDAALEQGLTPRSIDDVANRRIPRMAKALELAGYNGEFDATIDFIETEDGPLMLEAGPGCGPFGSGHPCGFAGDFRTFMADLEDGHGEQEIRYIPCEGVAFRNMDHILIAEPKTWKVGDKSNAILGWEEAADIAGRDDATVG